MTFKKGSKGTNVKTLQQKLKDLGFLNGKVDGDFGPITQKAVKDFQKSKGLVVDGIVGPKTIEALGIKLNTTSTSTAKKNNTTSTSTIPPVHGTAQEMDWWTSDIQKIYAKGVTAIITDVDKKISWRMKRFAGHNHADVQPLTKTDTAKMKKAWGGGWSWKRRAIFVTIDGVNYAASMHGMPHGGSNLDNNFPGHTCIHFTNSRTHATNRVDENHQKMVKKAAKAVL